MNHKRVWLALMPLALGLLLTAFFIGGLRQLKAAPAANLERALEPVVLSGAQLAAFDGVPLSDLVLYRYTGNDWEPIPYQFDEVTAAGAYTSTEDGRLDANDELVLMSGDTGEFAGASEWPLDATARSHPRFLITLSDPLTPGAMGAVYLYRSPNLPRSTFEYVSWDFPAQTLTGISYTLGFNMQQFLGVADLTLNGNGIDVLDRQKLRVQVSVRVGGIPISTTVYDEENFPFPIPPEVDLPVSGPVRAIGGDGLNRFAFYGSSARLGATMPLEDVPISPGTVLHIDYVQTSLDLLDPSVTGMGPAIYYDGNGVTAAIDGSPDTVPSTLRDWYAVSGAQGGWVNVSSVDPANGVAESYYLDDGAIDPNDTGDQRSFADNGLRVSDPNGVVLIDQAFYFTPGGADNWGTTVYTLHQNPLEVSAEPQSFVSGASTYLPLMLLQE